MKKFFNDKENKIFVSIIVITLIIASLPLFSKYCLLGHDADYHLLRIEALKDGILKGVPFLKINVLFFGGAGYASSMFYPDFLLYVPAVLRVLGVSINASWHIFIFMCIALCFASAFFSVLFMTKNKYAALIAGILFTLCSYHIDDIYVRAAVGEYTAFIFLPVFLYGLYNVCYEDMDKPQLLALSLAGILLCHTLSFVLCIIITVVILLICYKSFIRNKKLILKLAVTALITIALTACYMIPMLEQLLTDRFYVSKPWILPSQEATQAAGMFDFLFPTAGVGLLLFIIPRVIIKRKEDDNILKFADICIIAGIIPMIVSTDVFPWNKIDRFVSFIQFPWRLFQISSALLAMAGAIVIYKLGLYICDGIFDKADNAGKIKITEQILTVIVLMVMVFTCFYGYTKNERKYYDFSNDYYDYKPFTGSVIAGEWLPLRVTDSGELISQSEHAYDSDDCEVSFERKKNTIVISGNGSDYIDVPFIFYRGYAAKTASGEYLKVDGSAENGMTRVYTDGSMDEITVYYKGTAVQLVSRISSAIMAIFLIVCAVIFRKRRKA